MRDIYLIRIELGENKKLEVVVMVKNAFWFLAFGLSFVLLWLYYGGSITFVFINIVLSKKGERILLIVMVCAIVLCILPFATWVATQLFKVEFSVAA